MNWFWVRLNNYFNRASSLPRPKYSKQKIHWTKAEKPLNQMTPEERSEFATRLATESLKELAPKKKKYR